MGKILDFKDFKKKKAVINGNLDNAQLIKIGEMLEAEQRIVEELFQMTENYLKDIGYNPSDFVLDEDYVRDLLSTDMVEFMEGGEAVLELSFKAEIEGVVYRTLASAQSFYEDKSEMEVMLCKEDTEIGEWVVFVKDGQWDRGPGDDFFGEKNKPQNMRKD